MDAVTTSAWGQAVSATPIFDVAASSGVTATITATRSPFETAPEAIRFDLAMTGFDTNPPVSASAFDVTYRDKIIYWRASDNYSYTAPTQPLALDAADSGNRAQAGYGIGRLWEYVAQNPNPSLNIDVVIYEPSSGKYAKDTINLNVKDPAVEYPGTQTIFVSTTGVYTNKPAGAAETTNINTALDTMEGQNTTKHRVVLERGQTHSLTGTRTIDNLSGTISNFRLEANTGSGAAPIVQDNTGADNDGNVFFERSKQNVSGTTAEFLVSGIEFEGDHDPTDQSGRQANFIYGQTSGNSGDYFLINRCDIHGFARILSAPEAGAEQPNRRFVFCDTIGRDWGTCGMIAGNGSQFTFLGVRLTQHVDALSSTGPGSVADVSSGWCVRIPTASRIICFDSDTCPTTGWSPWDAPTMIALQSGWRILADATDSWVPIVMNFNVFESGRIAMYLRGSSGSDDRRPANGQVWHNFMVTGFQGGDVAECTMGGVSWKENILVTAGDKTSGPDGGKTTPMFGAIRFDNGSSHVDGNASVNVEIKDNTVVNLSNVALPNGVVQNAIGMTITQTGNVLHQPNAGGADALVSGSTGFTPRFKGYRLANGTLLSDYATPEAAGDIYTKSDGTGASTKPDYSVPA